jgi:hypothetical protein
MSNIGIYWTNFKIYILLYAVNFSDYDYKFRQNVLIHDFGMTNRKGLTFYLTTFENEVYFI